MEAKKRFEQKMQQSQMKSSSKFESTKIVSSSKMQHQNSSEKMVVTEKVSPDLILNSDVSNNSSASSIQEKSAVSGKNFSEKKNSVTSLASSTIKSSGSNGSVNAKASAVSSSMKMSSSTTSASGSISTSASASSEKSSVKMVTSNSKVVQKQESIKKEEVVKEVKEEGQLSIEQQQFKLQQEKNAQKQKTLMTQSSKNSVVINGASDDDERIETLNQKSPDEEAKLNEINNKMKLKHRTSFKSSISKFDKIEQQNNKNAPPAAIEEKCKVCEKPVYKMEMIKAEKQIFHKSCFKCCKCSKVLNLETYASNNGELFCRPHFKELFQPEVIQEEPREHVRRRNEVIIRENTPKELPPDVIRAASVQDKGLEELNSLIDLKAKFKMFETIGKGEESTEQIESNKIRTSGSKTVLARYNPDANPNGLVGVNNDEIGDGKFQGGESSEEEEGECEEGVEKQHQLAQKDKIMRERKKELGRFRKMLCHGKSQSLKQVFENYKEEDGKDSQKEVIQTSNERTEKMKELFEKEILEQQRVDAQKRAGFLQEDLTLVNGGEERKKIRNMFENINEDEGLANGGGKVYKSSIDMDVFEDGLCKSSRDLFCKLDKSTSQNGMGDGGASPQPRNGPVVNRLARQKALESTGSNSEEVIRYDESAPEPEIQTTDIANKFKFFENYQEKKEKKPFRITPPKEVQSEDDVQVYRDPNVITSDSRANQEQIKIESTSKMRELFKRMESQGEDHGVRRRGLKEFTPPRDGYRPEYLDNSDEENQEDAMAYTADREYLKEIGSMARAKSLREKFENQCENENGDSEEYGAIEDYGIEATTKDLRARFENYQDELQRNNARPQIKPNRFV